ncbi:metalloregulator ArsR/SmtB family transcription factor [Leucobacter sp. W1478]|uniref:metalloregulator ArsR/SmtB family transcription factor n=1 Tax=Leucobacter sp. W1478 TaxID=3439065 RepID=UPI003F391C84
MSSTAAEAGTVCTPTESHAMGAAAAQSLAGTLKGLADPLRLRMLSAIATDPRGESCVCDLAELSNVAQPTVSHHLKVLREVGLLEADRRGTWVWYRIPSGRRAAVTALLESFAPAAVVDSTRREAQEPLSNLDERVTHLAEELASAHPDLPRSEVVWLVRESHASLTRTARIAPHLIALTQNFAKQRIADLRRDRTRSGPQVLFVCVQNAGRSQLAAALTNTLSGGRVTARSAGSSPAAHVHPNVRQLLVEIEGELANERFPKPLTDDAVRAADVVITMGCGDVCPIIPGVRYEDWAVGNPALASAEGVAAIRQDIEARVRALVSTLIPSK